MGLASQHKQRVLASKQANQASGQNITEMNGSQYDRMLLEINGYDRDLKSIKSHIERNKQKAEILENFDAYVDGVLASESGVQDDVLMRVYMWSIDAGMFDRALEIASYAVAYKLTLPDDIKRDPATLLIDGITEAKIEDKDTFVKWLNRVEALTNGLDIHDEVSAKLYKALGNCAEEQGDLSKAITYYNTAIEFNDKIGLKNVVKALQKKIKDAEQNKQNS